MLPVDHVFVVVVGLFFFFFLQIEHCALLNRTFFFFFKNPNIFILIDSRVSPNEASWMPGLMGCLDKEPVDGEWWIL